MRPLPPEWDRSPQSESMTGREGRSESRDATEYVIEDPDSETGFRKKRSVRRKNRWLRLVGKGSSLVIPAAAAVVIAGLAVALVSAMRQDRQSANGPAPESNKIAALESIEERHDIEAAIALVEAYGAAATIDEKAALIGFPRQVKPLMEDWYAGHEIDMFEDASILAEAETIYQGRSFLMLDVVLLDGSRREFFLERTDDGYKIEWEMTVGYQPRSWIEFVKQKPPEAETFRLVCSKFRGFLEPVIPDRGEVVFVTLYSLEDEVEKVTGFCTAASPTAAKMDVNLAFADTSGMTLEVRYYGVHKGIPLFEIIRFVQDGWIVDYAALEEES